MEEKWTSRSEVADLHDKLLEAVVARDHDAFDDLYLQTAPAVARFAWSLSHSQEVVDELLQDTYLTLWRKPESVHLINGTVLPWLLVSCRNHARNYSRRNKRWRESIELGDDALLLDSADGSSAEELRYAMDSIAALPETDRQVCELVLLQGYSYREAARQLSISESSVGKRLHRSRRRLRKDTFR